MCSIDKAIRPRQAQLLVAADAKVKQLSDKLALSTAALKSQYQLVQDLRDALDKSEKKRAEYKRNHYALGYGVGPQRFHTSFTNGQGEHVEQVTVTKVETPLGVRLNNIEADIGELHRRLSNHLKGTKL